MDNVRWKLKAYLDKHNLSAYALTKAADLAPNTVYTIARGNTNQVRLETLAGLLSGLRKLTGGPVTFEDLLEYESMPEPGPMDDESKAWLEADLAPPLEPYDWGDVDPETLPGGQVEYVPGKGLMIVEDEQ